MNTDNYAILMLTSKFLELRLKYKNFRLEMAEYPNQYTDDAMRQAEQMIKDLEEALQTLKVKEANK
jgi:PIN domain nuclease of toxin-antitoxin system